MELYDTISNAISKHILLFTPNYNVVTYGEGAVVELNNVLGEYKNAHPTLEYAIGTIPIGTSTSIDPDFMCSLAYKEENQNLKVFCFGFMSAARENAFKGQNTY